MGGMRWLTKSGQTFSREGTEGLGDVGMDDEGG